MNSDREELYRRALGLPAPSERQVFAYHRIKVSNVRDEDLLAHLAQDLFLLGEAYVKTGPSDGS